MLMINQTHETIVFIDFYSQFYCFYQIIPIEHDYF